MAILMFVRGFQSCAVTLPVMLAIIGPLSWAYALVFAGLCLLLWGGFEAVVWIGTHRVTVAPRF